MPAEERIEQLYDAAAAFIQDGGLSWKEYWHTPRPQLTRYAEACNRRAERQRREAERR